MKMLVDNTSIFAIFPYMEKLYILMYRNMNFSGKGDPDHWTEIIIAQSPDKAFIDKIVKEHNLGLGDINDKWDFNHKYFIKEMPLQYVNERFDWSWR